MALGFLVSGEKRIHRKGVLRRLGEIAQEQWGLKQTMQWEGGKYSQDVKNGVTPAPWNIGLRDRYRYLIDEQVQLLRIASPQTVRKSIRQSQELLRKPDLGIEECLPIYFKHLRK